VTRLRAPQALLDRLIDADSAVRARYGIRALPSIRSLSVALECSADTIEQVMRRDDIVERGAVEQVSELLAVQLAAQRSIADDLVRSSRAVAGAVRRLSSMGIGANLPRQMCVEAVDTGPFEAAVFSTVDEVGWQVHVEYPAPISHRPLSLTWDRSPAERQSVCTGEVLVTGIDCAATAEVATHLNTGDYVVAPVVAESKVVGLLHAARALPMAVDDAGAALLSLLVSTFGAAYELRVWSHRVREHRDLVSARAARLVQSSDETLGSELEILSAPTHLRPEEHASAVTDPTSALDWLLTPRESEVMHLIAGGASNAEIAATLFIATETVKSHVKHILRKLGAVNRSEAISLYLDQG
jgi:DNA-binding CsgD family transcriptional regulator